MQQLTYTRFVAFSLSSAIFLLTLFICQASMAQTISPVPGIDYPYLFEDFHYTTQVVENFDPESQPFPPGYVLGPNDWFTSSGPSQNLSVQSSRAWYVGNWFEFGGWGWNYSGGATTCSDTSWFDTCGHHLTTIFSTIRQDHPIVTSLDNDNKTYEPNFLMMRTNADTYNSNGSIRLSSGIAARKGTWVARIMLPDFDGLRFHDQIGSTPVDTALDMYPAFWLQSAEHSIDRRSGIFKNGNDQIWSEANYELNNWFDPDDNTKGHKAMSTGVTWANELMSVRNDNPRLGTSGTAGKCYLVDDDGNGRWGDTNPRECFDILTGNEHGPLFITLYIVMSDTDLKYYVISWDEDLHHTRGNFYPGFDLLYMQTVDDMTHFAPPRLMRMLFDHNLKPPAGTGELQETKDVLVDWAFFTPRVFTETSSPSIWNVPGIVTKIRDHLWSQYNSNRSASQQIWRVNATGLDTAAPLSGLDNACLTWNEDLGPEYSFDVDLKTHVVDGRLFFAPETVVSTGFFTRHTTFRVSWKIYEVLSGGKRILRDTANEEGFIYEAPVSTSWWQNASSIDVEVTVEELTEPGLSGVCGTYTDSLRYYPW